MQKAREVIAREENEEAGKAQKECGGKMEVALAVEIIRRNEENCALDTTIIDGELSTPSNHKVFVYNLSNLDETVAGMRTSREVTGYSVKALANEETKKACAEWYQTAVR